MQEMKEAVMEFEDVGVLGTWALTLPAAIALSYAALCVRPIPPQISAGAAIVWVGCIVMPFLINPVPLGWIPGVVGTAAAIVIAIHTPWPDSGNRPGPMGV